MKKFLVCLFFVACWSRFATAQSVLAEAANHRVDVIMIGDSNQLYWGTGWDHGWAKALSRRFGLFGTGIQWLGEARGNGAGTGFQNSIIANAGAAGFDYDPPDEDPYNPANSGMGPGNVVYLAAGFSLSGIGVQLGDSSPYYRIGDRISGQMFARMLSPSARLRPLIRLGRPPYTNYQLGTSYPFSPQLQSGVVEMRTTQDVPLELRFESPMIAPFVTYYAQVENLDRSHGVAVSTLYGVGGKSTFDISASLRATSDELLSLLLETLQARQGVDDPRFVFRICSGLNDTLEESPSFPGDYPGGSDLAYVDNMQAIIDRLSAIVLSHGWNPSNIEFVVATPHPVSDPNEASLDAYAAIAPTLSTTRGASVIRFTDLTTFQELRDRSWFAGSLDVYHLTSTGYEVLVEREIAQLLGQACRADYDASGGVDSDDVTAFFFDWDAASPLADFNRDAGTDGDDIIDFFAMWDLGC